MFVSTLSKGVNEKLEMNKERSHVVRNEGDFDERQEKYVNKETTVIEEFDEDDSDEPERVLKYKRRTNSLPRQTQIYLAQDDSENEKEDEGEDDTKVKISEVPLLDSKDLKKLTKDKRSIPRVMMMNEEIRENLNSPYNYSFFKLVEGYMIDAIDKYITNEEIENGH